jgi:uncharacterized protein (TIGR03545 family)
MKLFRWKAIVPLVLVLALLVIGWTLFVDRLLRKGIEAGGTAAVGAKVELESARIHLFRGNVTLRGLQVTNPHAPMTNIVQLDEIVADIAFLPLLEKKVVVDTVAIRGLRFDTPRKTSGAIPQPAAPASRASKSALEWAQSVNIPGLDLSVLGKVIELASVRPDSLQSLGEARALVARADSIRTGLERDLRAADPGPVADSARALADRLRGGTPRSLGLQGTRDAISSVQRVLGQVRTTRDRVTSLKQRVDTAVVELRGGAAALDRARQADYAYAQRLVRIPSLSTPDVSMALFGRMAVAKVQPVLYWLDLAEQYIPPGLRPKPNPGPKRARMAGITVTFPKQRTWPTFLLRHADASLTLGGEGATAGDYGAWIEGVTTEPAVYGGPLRFAAQRTAAAKGPRQLRAAGVIDRSKREPHDSLDALVSGVAFPAADIAAAGARLEFPDNTVQFALDRRGDGLAGLLHITAPGVRWVRTAGDTAGAAAASLGSRQWVEALVWRAVSSVRDLDLQIRFSGRPGAPRLEVTSNVGSAVSSALTREVGAEVTRVQARARARVDSIVGQQVAAARARLTALESDVQGRLALQQQQLQDAQAELERRLQDLGQVAPGVRLPSVPRIRPN